jgi:hypothetical protein
MRLARTVSAVETRRRVAHLTYTVYRLGNACKAAVCEAVQVGELHRAFAFRCENLLPYEGDVAAHMRVVAVQACRPRQWRRLVNLRRERPCWIMLVTGGDVARRQRLAGLFAARGYLGGMTNGAIKIEVYNSAWCRQRGGRRRVPIVT